MPFVHIRIAGASIDARIIEGLQRETTALMADVLRKKADLTAVLVEQAETGAWAVGARPVTVAAHLVATVTAGTNDASEKADFVRRAHALLQQAAGSALPLATYVVIDEVPANAWGYGGKTQAERSGTPA